MTIENPSDGGEMLSGEQSLGTQLTDILLILLVFFVLAGDLVPHHNEPHYLCRAKHYWNPDWCQGDLFLDSPDAHLFFVWTFGWVTKWLSLTATAWTGRLLVWTLLAWAWQRLSWRLVPRPLYSVLSAALFVILTGVAHLAGEWVVRGVEAKCFAYVFVLLAMRELVDLRWNRLWLLLGAASAFHALVGGWSVLVCGGIWITSHRNQTSLRSMLPGLVGGGLFALLGLVPALAMNWHVPPELADEANQIYVFYRLPHHLAPLSLPREELGRQLFRHSLLLMALWTLWISRLPRWYRLGQFAWGAVLLAVLGFVIELAFWNHPSIAAKLLRYYWFRLTDFAAPMAVAIGITLILANGIHRERRWAFWGLGITTAFTCLFLVAYAWSRLYNLVPPADQKMRDYAAWVDVCQWVDKNTPPNALFLTPRLASTFKWRTGRPEVVTRKDIPQDARSMVEWRRRIETIHSVLVDGEIKTAKSLGHLGTTRLKSVAKQFHADYVLTDRRRRVALPIMYENEEYVVYRMPDD